MNKWAGKTLFGSLAMSVAILPLAVVGFGAGQKKPTADDHWKVAKPMLAKYCLSCHTGAQAAAKIDLARIKTTADAKNSAKTWSAVLKQLRGKTMPPAGSPVLAQKERDKLINALKNFAPKAPAPSKVTMRRLNRAEYDNTVRDLLGISESFSADFPSDDVGNGFDNMGDVLTISPLLMEKYLDAAEKAASVAIVTFGPRTVRFESGSLETDTGRISNEGYLLLTTNGYGAANFSSPEPGPFKVRVRAYGQQAGPEIVKMELRVGGKKVTTFEVAASGEQGSIYESPVDLGKGKERISLHFINDFYDPSNPNVRARDRNLFIFDVEIIGPLGAQSAPPISHQRLITSRPEGGDFASAARSNLRQFLPRAFRRPVDDATIEKYVRLVESVKGDKGSFEDGMRLAVQAALSSPYFLFRIENSISGDVTPFELANRLSYALWSTMPDDQLFQAAANGSLNDATTLRAQIRRMILDKKSDALAENFATQWLQLRKLEQSSPDPELFPGYSDAVRDASLEETKTYFSYVLRQNRPVSELLDSNYSFINKTLGEFYGVPNPPRDAQLQKFVFSNNRRGGLLTQSSILTVTSNPNRTSPVKRGKWVLEQILGTPPPPPPPGVDALPESQSKAPTRTIKERLARHREDPQCAVCHVKMDSIGYVFENYDAIGQWRTHDGQFAVDATGQIPGEAQINGMSGLKVYLLSHKADFMRSLTSKLLSYSLGRGITEADTTAIEDIARTAEKSNGQFATLVESIMVSRIFRTP